MRRSCGGNSVITIHATVWRDLRAQAVARWEAALSEARGEMQRTQRDLEAQFSQLKAA